MDDAELQDEPLQIRLMDHDTYSANDAIGKVYLDLNPLLLPPAGSTAKTALTDATNSLSGGNCTILKEKLTLYYFSFKRWMINVFIYAWLIIFYIVVLFSNIILLGPH